MEVLRKNSRSVTGFTHILTVCNQLVYNFLFRGEESLLFYSLLFDWCLF